MLGIAIKQVDYQDSLEDKYGDCHDSSNEKNIVYWQSGIQFIDVLWLLEHHKVTVTATALKIIMLAFPMAWVSQFYSDSDDLRNSDSDSQQFRLPILFFTMKLGP